MGWGDQEGGTTKTREKGPEGQHPVPALPLASCVTLSKPELSFLICEVGWRRPRELTGSRLQRV